MLVFLYNSRLCQSRIIIINCSKNIFRNYIINTLVCVFKYQNSLGTIYLKYYYLQYYNGYYISRLLGLLNGCLGVEIT